MLLWDGSTYKLRYESPFHTLCLVISRRGCEVNVDRLWDYIRKREVAEEERTPENVSKVGFEHRFLIG